MHSNEKLKMTALIIAGALMVLLSIGAPNSNKRTRNPKRVAYIESEAIVKNCVPGTQVNLPTLQDKLSFLCFLDIKSGLLDNMGPVSIPKPVREADGNTVSID